MTSIRSRLIPLILLTVLILFGADALIAAESSVQIVHVPVGQSASGSLGQYDSYVATFAALPGDRLSIAFGVAELENVFVGVADVGAMVPEGGNFTPQLALWRIDTTVRRTTEAPIPGALFAWLTDLGAGMYQLSITNFSAEYTITPGILLVHDDGTPLFQTGQPDRGLGLVTLANGNPMPLADALQQASPPQTDTAPDTTPVAMGRVHLFSVPENQSGAAPLKPGEQYQITFSARPGDHLSFATMLVETNDFFFSFNEWGVPLYDNNGVPRTAVLTKYVNMWDAGTEFDERPGSGDNQPARQPAPNTGAADPNRAVRFAHDDYGPIPLAGVEDIIDVFLKPTGVPNQFVLQITNVSGGRTLSPGVVLLHRDFAPLFTIGQEDYGDGLESLAEDGNPWPLADTLSQRYGP